MSLRKYLIICLLIILGYLIVDYFKLFGNYWEFIQILPIPNNLKRIIKYINRVSSPNTQSIKSSHRPPINYKKRQRRNVNGLHKKMVASNQQWKCALCHSMLDYTYEIDHIDPLYQGGNNNLDNLQALCRNCHGRKTAQDTLK